MGARLLQRRLKDVQRQLTGARESLRILQEQVAVWDDALEDVRIRALVSENPLQSQDFQEISRHVAVARAELQRRIQEVQELESDRDSLLREWTPEDK